MSWSIRLMIMMVGILMGLAIMFALSTMLLLIYSQASLLLDDDAEKMEDDGRSGSVIMYAANLHDIRMLMRSRRSTSLWTLRLMSGKRRT